MKKSLMILFFLVTSILSFSNEVFEGDKFSVNFAVIPTKILNELAVEDKKVIITKYLCREPSLITIVTYLDYPEEIIKDIDKEALLNTSIDGGIEASKGQIISKNDIVLGDFAGKEAKFTSKQGDYTLNCYLRAYLVNNRVYLLNAATTQDNYESITKFFDSFKLKTK